MAVAADFLMVAIMASGMVFFMTLFMTLLREGLVPDFHMRWMSSFAIALSIVFPLALGMLQIAKKTVSRILKVVEYPDRRIKPIVYTMVSSGIRLGAWDYLKWGHVIPIPSDGNDEYVAAKIMVYTGEEEQYFTFISPEAYRALADWMTFREKCGEKITTDSWVMRNLWDNRITKGPDFFLE